VLGFAVLAWRGGVVETFRGWALYLMAVGHGLRPALPSAAKTQRFPYALAIALGTLGATAWLGTR
jgi:hypothetical protein